MRLHWNTRPLPDCKWTDWSTELTCAFSFLSPSSNQLHQGNPCHFPKQRFPTGLLDFLLEEKKKVKTSCGLNVNNACLELHSRIKLMQWVQRFAFLTSIKDPHSYPSQSSLGLKLSKRWQCHWSFQSLAWLSLTVTAAKRRCVPLSVTNQLASNSSYSLLTMEDMNWRHFIQVKGHKYYHLVLVF